jgi:carbonic anhydrase
MVRKLICSAAVRTLSRRHLLRDAVLLGLFVPLLAACGRSAAPAERKPAAEPAEQEAAASGAAHAAGGEQAAAAGPHWDYGGSEGPDVWGSLDPSFATCSGGRSQSPIDLPLHAGASGITQIVFDYKPTKLNLANNGHTIQADYDPGSTMSLDGKRYELLQFHFHVPSEHRLGGIEFPMEVHLVHRASDGALAVLGAFFYGGLRDKPGIMASTAKTPVLDKLWEAWPSKGGKVSKADTVDVSELLPFDRSYLTYEGSLTTPPCTEGVRWLLLTTPVLAGQSHVEKFLAIVGRNARPPQPLNGRIVGAGYAQAREGTPSAQTDPFGPPTPAPAGPERH